MVRQPEAIEFNEVGKRRPKTRGYIDGCFDLCHTGHFNAIRQASALCDTLVCGANSDAEIMINKGPPVLNIDERMKVVTSCKWIKECIADMPYTVNEKILEE